MNRKIQERNPSKTKIETGRFVSRPDETRNRTESEKPEKFIDSVAGKLVATILAVIATVLVGDVIIKRNIESATAEYEAIASAVVRESNSFIQVENDLNEIVDSRRAAAQLLTEYSVDRQISDFSDYYETYIQTVANWNDKRADIYLRLASLTDCERLSQNPEFKTHFQTISSGVWSPDYPRASGEQLLDTGLSANVFCPHYYLFETRTEDEVVAAGAPPANDLRSVFEVFRYMHFWYVDSIRREVVACARAATRVQNLGLDSCQVTSKSETPGECIRHMLSDLDVSRVCPVELYPDGTADIGIARFDRLNYLWRVAREQIHAYRRPALTRACEHEKVFWYRHFWILGDPCPDLIDRYA